MKRQLHAENSPKAVFFLTSLLVLITIVPFYYYPQQLLPFTWLNISPSSPPVSFTPARDDAVRKIPAMKSLRLLPEECDLFRGDWVPNPRAPYYTNETCWAIHEHQNCIKFGRPDTAFMKWRWKPEGCELPIFNPALFLDLVAGKSMAFVGDSVARNQMQSLMCLLSRVTYPIDLLKNETKPQKEQFTKFFYPKYNFTVANYWTPFLVRTDPSKQGDPSDGSFHLHVDEPEPGWAAEIESADYVIVSAGQWFFRPNYFYEKSKLVGCHWCRKPNVTDTTLYYGYRRAFRSTFAYLNSLASFNGTVFLRTYAPSHFENGEWNGGGDCRRTSPIRSNETRLEGLNLQMYMTQLEEFRAAKEMGEKRGLKYHLLDVTSAMLLRPDGHPSRYGHPANVTVTLARDCVHWCLPGPVDSWNDFMLEVMKRDRLRAAAAARGWRNAKAR